jgi:hypothetical protein
LEEEGIAALHAAAARHGRLLPTGGSFADAIDKKTALLLRSQIGFLVNIGGSQTSLGTCPHAAALPSGYAVRGGACDDPGRGVIERCAEREIPYLHLLNIQSMALRYGIPLTPAPGDETGPDRIMRQSAVSRVPLLLVIIGLFVLFLAGHILRQGPARHPPFRRKSTGD